jgi:hypothetical protein
METLSPLASALGLGMLAGARLYATVLAVGLLIRFQWITLPAAWQSASVLGDTRVLIVAGVLCAIEFIADKIAWVDSVWDSIHTFIRPIGAALLTTSLFSNVDLVYQVLLFLVAGGVAFSGHSTKAAARLAVNHSPEPFSNVAVSLVEDTAAVGGLYLLATHPWVLAAIVLVFLLLFVWLAPRTYRALRAEWATMGARVRSWFGGAHPPRLGPAERQWIAEHWSGRALDGMFAVVATRDLRGFNNRLGRLCLAGREAVFFCRKWGRLVAREIGPIESIEVRKRLLSDEVVLVTAQEGRKRFDLLAGQLEDVRAEMKRLSPASPAG